MMTLRGQNVRQQGFTLIEMMIGMAIGLVILAGLTTVFVSYNNAGRAVSSRTERMSDLYLVSHIMQSELRQSLSAQMSSPNDVLSNLAVRGVSKPANYPTTSASFNTLPLYHAASKSITYQDLEGNVGIFQYQRTANDRIYWLRPLASTVSGSGTFQELIRDLNSSTGMAVTVSGSMIDVVFTATYTNENKASKDMKLSFKTWARN